MNFLRRHLSLLVILAGAFLLRILIPLVSYAAFHDPAVFYADDTPSYIQPAGELLSKGTFTDQGVPELFRTPGYSLLLVPGIFLHGIEWVTIALQTIIGTATVFLVYRLAMRVFENDRIAKAAAFLYAFEPLAIAFCGLLLSETLFAFFFVAFIYCFFGFLKKNSWRSCILSAVLLSLTTYIRPVSLYLNGVLLLAGAVYFMIKRNKKAMIMILAFAAASAGLNGVWIVRNAVTAGYSGFSSVTDVNLYSYQAAALLAKKQNVPYPDMMETLNRKAADHQRENRLTEAQILEYMRKEGTAAILRHPFDYALIHAKGVAVVVFTPGAVEILKLLKAYPHRGGLVGRIVDEGLFPVLGDVLKTNPVFFFTLAVLFIQLALYYLCAVCHFFSHRRVFVPFVVFLLIIMAYMLFVSGGPHAVDRFRHPLMPAVCLFAGSGLIFLKDKFASRICGKSGGRERGPAS